MQGRETNFSAFSANGVQRGIRGLDVPNDPGLGKRLIRAEVINLLSFLKLRKNKR
jgi:hypothetical protein